MPESHTERNTGMSNPAKILLAYMRCSGISDAKTLAADLDIPIRTIQRLKLECATCANDAISGAANDAKCARYGVSEAPNAPDMALSRADSNITNKNTTPGESRERENADELNRQAYLAGLELKQGKVAKSARAIQRTKGELDGGKGITFADGELTVDDVTAARIRARFPGVDVTGVCAKAAAEIARMNHPSRDDAMAVLGKWAQIAIENKSRAQTAPGEIVNFRPTGVRNAKPREEAAHA
jgi:hypothetical protein